VTALDKRNDILRLGKGLYCILAPHGARFPYCNSFLVTGSETAIIDTGIGRDKLKEIDSLARIDTLIISHSHPDHILAWDILEDRRILLPVETPESIKDLQELGERFTGTPENGAMWAERVGRGLGIRPLREPDARFSNGDIFDFGSVRLEALSAPGHLDDHYCFFDHESGTLLTIDIDFTSFGPWYANPEGSIELFEQSVKRVMEIERSRVCSSHKKPVEGRGHELFQAFLDAFDRQRSEVEALCEKPATVAEMVAVSPFYRNRLFDRQIQNIFEEQMIRKNLDLLVREGRVTEHDGFYERTGY